MTVNNSNRDDDVQAEDGEIIDDMHHRYIDNEYKNLSIRIILIRI